MRRLINSLAKIAGLTVGNFSRMTGLGHGSALPGRIARLIDPDLFQQTRQLIRRDCIFITGTNGKSTTTHYIQQLLMAHGYSVATNYQGANLLSGLATVCLSVNQPIDYLILEVDEATVPLAAQLLRPSIVIGLNFSRDQLDRYAEIDQLIEAIKVAQAKNNFSIVYNAGNAYSQLLADASGKSTGYRVVSEVSLTSLDQPICPSCLEGLLTNQRGGQFKTTCSACNYSLSAPALTTYFSNGLLKIDEQVIGCESLELAETVTAAASTCQMLGMSSQQITQALAQITPEAVHQQVFIDRSTARIIELLLVKNPESFNRQLNRLTQLQGRQICIVINKQYADGRDTSWLWDVNFELLPPSHQPIIIGGQAYTDLALRLEVANQRSQVMASHPDLIQYFDQIAKPMTILANYTAFTSLEELLKSRYSGHRVDVKALDNQLTVLEEI